jgi:hypothetical protein
MTRSSGFCLTLLLVGLLCFPCIIKANPAPWPMAGGTVATKSLHKTIRMDAEEVTIRLDGGSHTVTAVYHMVNTGESTTEWVGFPKGRIRDSTEQFDYPDFIQFYVWVNGKKALFSKEGNVWMAGRVTFPGHATTMIRVVYQAHNTNYLRRGAGGYAEYIVGTGRLWKGNIGRAIFTVDGSAIGGASKFDAELNVPSSRKLLSDRTIRFDVTDFKPDRDAVLHISIKDRRRARAR